MMKLDLTDIPESLYALVDIQNGILVSRSFANFYWHASSDLRFAKVHTTVLAKGTLLQSENARELELSCASSSEMFDRLGADPAFQLIILRQEIAEMLLVRSVGHMIIYIEDVMKELALGGFINVLKDSESNEPAQPHLIQKITNSVDKLSRKGFSSLVDFLHKQGINLQLEDGQRQGLNKIIRDRNLFVHQHGVITESYYKAFAPEGKEVGDHLELTLAEVTGYIQKILKFVGKVDDAVRLQNNLHVVDLKSSISERFLTRINSIMRPYLDPNKTS